MVCPLQGTELECVDFIFVECDVNDSGLKYSITLQVIDGKIHKIFSTEAMEVNTLGSKTELNISDVLDDIEDQRWVSTEMKESDIKDVEEPNSLVFAKLKYVSEASPNPKPQVVLPYASPNWISSQFLNQVNKHARRQPACTVIVRYQ
ncbi:hypothetical protein AQUCO_01800125v1 [Aquilegia coerulea]|uniref:Uncharacterized protein n=1 Tax=Aquilegia coerulea TaxID=218851 RepID=A0A2G5DK19_AQUCA|nr:hypothetical protein AQUCO_01800125v1 [Aquilegia coerulea]